MGEWCKRHYVLTFLIIVTALMTVDDIFANSASVEKSKAFWSSQK
jgi:hypothetical protein